MADLRNTIEMQTRLLAFLAESEDAIRALRPEPRTGAVWETSRTVNYTLGLARMVFGAREGSGEFSQLGSVLLQSFELADGSLCLRASLGWKDSETEISHPIYEKPELEWNREAGRLAEAWLDGPPIASAPAEESPLLAAAG
jgi:hypothetical protein